MIINNQMRFSYTLYNINCLIALLLPKRQSTKYPTYALIYMFAKNKFKSVA